jgi:hypothetical protein
MGRAEGRGRLKGRDRLENRELQRESCTDKKSCLISLKRKIASVGSEGLVEERNITR